MSELCLFAGTLDGRRLAQLLAGQPVKVCLCVATAYGETLSPKADNIETHTGRMDGDAMRAFFTARRFDAVVDATHPFATEASQNIETACRDTGIEYLRLSRETEARDGGAIIVDSIQSAAEYLSKHSGRALLTTGSKELSPYTTVPDYRERFYPRVLPMQASIAACENAGFAPAHIIAMQGPFSVEMNVAMLKAVGAKWLVTKESGSAGGLPEKIEAARQAGAQCVIIGQPPQRRGLGFQALVNALSERFGLRFTQRVDLVGMGMGTRDTLTVEAESALREADCFIGSKRALDALSDYNGAKFAEIMPNRIMECILAHPEYHRLAVVFSGDTGFYSGMKRLLPLLNHEDVRVFPGLSTLQVLCARVKTSWDDAVSVSLHGREGSIVPALQRCGKVFGLLDGDSAVKRVCADLLDAGMGNTILTVGERLSYPEERITRGTAAELSEFVCDPLSALLAEYPAEAAGLNVGLPDEAFIRESGGSEAKAVPMTKSEARAVSLSKLRLTEDAVAWDIGAGTGSVSVEMALNCPKGHVYAVECRADAADLIERNARKFALRNLTVVRGTAPEALHDLPAPTHVFIGGTGGGMDAIVQAVLDRNPHARMVINAIALESAGEIAAILRKYGFEDAEVVQLSVARSRRAGGYHLMTGMNPITIAAMQRREADAREN